MQPNPTESKECVSCLEDCSCHNGARYDQIECRCDWFCGEDVSDELIQELNSKNEKYKIITIPTNAKECVEPQYACSEMSAQ